MQTPFRHKSAQEVEELLEENERVEAERVARLRKRHLRQRHRPVRNQHVSIENKKVKPL